MSHPRANFILGLICVALAVLVVFLWVPLDTDTGLIEKVRRRVAIGDALAPTVAAVFVGLGGAMVLLSDRSAPDQPSLSLGNMAYLTALLALLGLAFLVMRWAGPAAVTLMGGEDPYRVLRDTAPWKWIGFALGGVTLVTGLIAGMERRMSLRALLIGLGAVAALILLFDLPFDDLLLPPNGDV